MLLLDAGLKKIWLRGVEKDMTGGVRSARSKMTTAGVKSTRSRTATARVKSTEVKMTKAVGVRILMRLRHSQIVVGASRNGRSEAARESGQGNEWRSQEYKIGDDECDKSQDLDALLSQPGSGWSGPQS